MSDWTDMRLALRSMQKVDAERLEREVMPQLRASRRRRKRLLRDSRAMWQFQMLRSLLNGRSDRPDTAPRPPGSAYLMSQIVPVVRPR